MQIRNEKSAVCCCIFHENLHGFFCPCFADDVSNLLFKQNGPIRLAMKRTADQAGLPDNSHRLRLTVAVPPDKVTDDRTMSFFVDCDTTFTVDNVKLTLLNQIYLTTEEGPPSHFVFSAPAGGPTPSVHSADHLPQIALTPSIRAHCT